MSISHLSEVWNEKLTCNSATLASASSARLFASSSFLLNSSIFTRSDSTSAASGPLIYYFNFCVLKDKKLTITKGLFHIANCISRLLRLLIKRNQKLCQLVNDSGLIWIKKVFNPVLKFLLEVTFNQKTHPNSVEIPHALPCPRLSWFLAFSFKI